ncbi:leucine-tRNA ligase [Rhinocladiella mackenziei CBS 650.93]|uniref:leucine--tRNA ligase n=1 Tax=Rhinocladiella mackenziei CBS 650.93 TaxID=1442369 RepID=A0A0D2J5D3_9EURO|nr:leucine-tRNA ligase [Rhinocladiella mackenziei CBS 650.93]KIX04230.1 leucine-tRNA ligase [Rhinocladiella mackenziei CBS 650.93]
MATQIPVDPALNSANTLRLENTHNRDVLIAIEKKYQKEWQKNKVFESDAPTTTEIPFGSVPAADIRKKYPKFFGTFAYPYMNGTLHAGHSFTVSKVEFTAGFERLTGKRVLFPLGFHCTGMPIKACADKLVEDVKRFGQNFENYHEEEEDIPPESNGAPVAPTQGINVRDDVTKFKSKKGKQAAKTIKTHYQFQTMLAMGIPKEEIHKFADANYWLEYFPPLCEQDLNDFGARIDWRRKFVTTDANPYYDAFVRWQMNRLHELNKILYGKRYTIYSPKDGQPCMDHDRTKGEGVGPTEYTALKLRVKEWSPEAAREVESKIPKDANVYFVPATLRPETMYGQTCCFVGPKIKYGIFKVSEKEYYVVTKRAAWNMAFQGIFFDEAHFPRDQEELQPVVELPGSVFVGTLVNAPLSAHPHGVRILPMETVSATKGTGVVTSVPSDSPDDFATVRDLAKKAEFYGIKKEWAEPEIIPIIDTPAYGNLAAKHLVEAMKIQSPKDAALLAEAKDLVYKEGFYNGTMLVGEFKGEKVSDAKEKVRNSLIKSGEAFPFADPSAEVISRSADECVVAYVPQWFLNYGENDKEWQGRVLDYVKDKDGLETYTHETENQFVANLEWLNQWACARTYGLGSKLPWDPTFLVESLSDSTIYMSYYTIAHFLHGDKFGVTPGLLPIKPEQMIDDVWDYIFTRTNDVESVSKSSEISVEDLQTLRRSFEYWYPLDMRSSGKDLIPNHLTFFLYVHLALFPREYWPRSVRSNGHLLLNGDKMSKSTGNFLTLSQAVKKFGADATRIALADAGDGMEDANFEEKGANAAIMRMYTLKEWIEDTLKDSGLRNTQGEVIWDKLFEDEMDLLVHEAYQHYSDTNFKLALKSALYDFQSARDFYREACLSSGTPMSRPLILRYVELQSLLIATIAPHWAEYIWLEVLHKDSSIQLARWPEVPVPDPSLTAVREYVKTTSSNITSAEAQAAKKMAKGKTAAFDPRKPKRITIFVASNFPAWQDKYVELVREMLAASTLNDDKALNGQVAKLSKGPEMKKAMPFVQALKKRLTFGKESPEAVFNRKLPFDEVSVLHDMKKGLMKTTGCKDVVIVSVGEDKSGLPPMAEHAVPGSPSFLFENIEA